MGRNTPKPEELSAKLLDKELAKLAVSKEAYYKEIESVNIEIVSLREELERVKEKGNAEASVLRAEVAKIVKQRDELTKQLVSKQKVVAAEIEALDAEIVARQEKREEISLSCEKETDMIKREHQKVDEKIRELKSLREIREQEDVTLNIKRSEVEARIRDLSGKQVILDEKSAKIKMQIDELTAKQEQINKAIETEQTLHNLNAKQEVNIIGLQSGLDKKIDQYNSLAERQNQFKIEKAELNQKAVDLVKWSESLREKDELLHLKDLGLKGREKQVQLKEKYMKEAQDGTR